MRVWFFFYTNGVNMQPYDDKHLMLLFMYSCLKWAKINQSGYIKSSDRAQWNTRLKNEGALVVA